MTDLDKIAFYENEVNRILREATPTFYTTKRMIDLKIENGEDLILEIEKIKLKRSQLSFDKRRFLLNIWQDIEKSASKFMDSIKKTNYDDGIDV